MRMVHRLLEPRRIILSNMRKQLLQGIILLTVYELTIENEASHPVRIDMSFNGTYPNITMMIPTKSFQRLYVPSANYTVLFTYYSGQYGSDQVINYEEMTGYYVTYNLEVLGLSYIKYTGFSLQDIMVNIDYSRTNINQNVDVVDHNVLAIPYPPPVPQRIVTPEMFWIGIGIFVVSAFMFAIGGAVLRGARIAKNQRVFYKSQGAVAEELAEAEGKSYYRGR
jgi:hypothetical protein